jgi:hypothetical protein
MKNTLEDSAVNEQTEGLEYTSVPVRTEINDAVKRVEQHFEASKAAVSDALEEGKSAAKHLLKRGRDAAEDYIDDATYKMKRNPQAVVALAFGAGALAGAVLGVLLPFGVTRLAASSRRTSKEL